MFDESKRYYVTLLFDKDIAYSFTVEGANIEVTSQGLVLKSTERRMSYYEAQGGSTTLLKWAFIPWHRIDHCREMQIKK